MTQAAAATRVHVALTQEPIDVAALCALVQGPGDGAVAVFTGVVRDHNDGRPVLRLDYEAYPAMAEAEMRRIAAAVMESHALGGLAIVHRTGALAIGDVSIAVVAASEHRGDAFDACRDAVERVKHDVPIWKREHHPDGARWVDARCVEETDG